MIGVVIVNYRSDELTVRFIREDLSRVTLPLSIVVVDNGATEEDAAILQEQIPQAIVLRSENKGFAAGNNAGVKYLIEKVHPTHILLTNNDIHLREGVVERLVQVLDAHPEAAAVGPEVLGTDGVRQGPWPYLGLWNRYVWMYLSKPFLSPEVRDRRFGFSYPQSVSEGPQYVLSGCFLVINPSVYAAVDGMDESTFLYAEENILSDRFAKVGKAFYFVPSVSVIHDHGRTIGSRYDARQRSLLQFESMAYYYRNYRGYGRLSIILVRSIFSLILRLK